MTTTVTTATKRAQRSARPRSGRVSGSAMPEGRSAAAQKAYERRQRRTGALRQNGAMASRDSDTRMLAKRIPFVVLVLALLVSGMGLTLWLSTNSTGQSYELAAAKQQNEALRNKTAALEQAVEAGNSAPDLARKANELGMVQSSNVTRLVVGPDGVVRVEGTPQPAEGPGPGPLTSVRPQVAKPVAPPPVSAPAPVVPPAPVELVTEAPSAVPQDEAPQEVPPNEEVLPPVGEQPSPAPLVDPGTAR